MDTDLQKWKDRTGQWCLEEERASRPSTSTDLVALANRKHIE